MNVKLISKLLSLSKRTRKNSFIRYLLLGKNLLGNTLSHINLEWRPWYKESFIALITYLLRSIFLRKNIAKITRIPNSFFRKPNLITHYFCTSCPLNFRKIPFFFFSRIDCKRLRVRSRFEFQVGR